MKLICRIGKKPAMKSCSLRIIKRSQVVRRSLVKRFYWEELLAHVLVRKEQTCTDEPEVAHVYNVMDLVQ